MKRKFGYIIDLASFTLKGDDNTWEFERYNKDGTTTPFNGIDTKRDLSNDSNVVIKGNADEFNLWANEFAPPIEE